MRQDPQIDYGGVLDRGRGRDVAGLMGAGVAVLALHAGLAAWALQRPDGSAETTGSAMAVMIDFAPEPAAPETDLEQISDQMNDAPPTDTPSPETPTAEPPREEAPAPPEPITPPEITPPPRGEAMMEPAPLPDPVEALVEEIETVEAEVPMPRRRGALQELTEEAPRTPARETVRAAAPPPSVAVKVKANAAPVVAAPKTSVSSPGREANAKWQARLSAHLERRKRYPASVRNRRIESVALVNFSIDGAGQVKSASLAQSSGVPDLDAEAVAMVLRASPVPAPPTAEVRNITVPVRFNPQ